MRERDVQGKVVGHARRRHVIAVKLSFGNGWPDYMFLHSGKALFVEFKGDHGRLEKLQAHIHGSLRDAGFDVMTISDPDVGIQAIDAWIGYTELTSQATVVDYSDIIKKTVENRK